MPVPHGTMMLYVVEVARGYWVVSVVEALSRGREKRSS